ncbi:MBL fold metallo-hydrolase [Flagellatimonas centrodinii]|uniref:MBL fold metallo-hydrolase n=1 Tax=Flagellatimonas centrodinii TaxID=2806210 RepID=UPI001FEF12AC|nr:MBL fold metallo-hydrolase [Flagellatimonas centrodinii]ULQ46774.1 MBL fold metallo-hydrolase [Flagellatimonas centrodinii]
MRFASLGSGSKGNGTVVEAGGTRVLIDCGFTLKDTEQRLARLGLEGGQLDAILVTHEHGDHLGGVGRLARRYRTPVYLTHGTARVWHDDAVPDIRRFDPDHGFTIGALDIEPFAVPHDAAQPCQYRIGHGSRWLGVISDLGHVTPHVVARLDGCDALLLECNHDPQMLADGPYPYRLKQRVGGDFGHLSNRQSAALLQRLDRRRLQHLILTHLSEVNNTPALARAAIIDVLEDDPAWCRCADQGAGLAWCDLVA